MHKAHGPELYRGSHGRSRVVEPAAWGRAGDEPQGGSGPTTAFERLDVGLRVVANLVDQL